MTFRAFQFLPLFDILDLNFWSSQVLVKINCNVGSVGSEIYRLISERLSDFHKETSSRLSRSNFAESTKFLFQGITIRNRIFNVWEFLELLFCFTSKPEIFSNKKGSKIRKNRHFLEVSRKRLQFLTIYYENELLDYS